MQQVLLLCGAIRACGDLGHPDAPPGKMSALPAFGFYLGDFQSENPNQRPPMSSTRRAAPNAELSQERWLSDPSLALSRGISGTAVVAKAEMLCSARQRCLLYFLQGLSLRAGGIRRLAAEVRPYLRPRKTPIREYVEDCGFGPVSRPGIDPRNPERLEDWLVQLCINPRMTLARAGDEDEEAASAVMSESIGEARDDSFFPAARADAEDIISDLYRFQQNYTESAAQDFVQTSIGAKVFDGLDYCRETGKMVVIQGNARIGKTTAARAWCEQHLGQARYATLSAVQSKTILWKTISKALGVAAGGTYKSTQIQSKIEDLLPRSGLMLVIDEAHYLWPQTQRIYGRPELVDWINTALCNNGVPVALVTTPQFAYRKHLVETQTGWTSEQLSGRIKRYTMLPERPDRSDLEAVARRLLPDADRDAIRGIVAYAIATERFMPSVVDTADEAKMLARRAGRSKVLFDDVERALDEYRVPSDTAQKQAFEAPDSAAHRSKKRGGKRLAVVLQNPGKTPAGAAGGRPGDLTSGLDDGQITADGCGAHQAGQLPSAADLDARHGHRVGDSVRFGEGVMVGRSRDAAGGKACRPHLRTSELAAVAD